MPLILRSTASAGRQQSPPPLIELSNAFSVPRRWVCKGFKEVFESIAGSRYRRIIYGWIGFTVTKRRQLNYVLAAIMAAGLAATVSVACGGDDSPTSKVTPTVAATATTTIVPTTPIPEPTTRPARTITPEQTDSPSEMQAPIGTKPLIQGRVLSATEEPLVGVKVRVKNVVAETGTDGSFTLHGVPDGAQVLLVDGSTTSVDGGSYPVFSLHLEIESDSETIIERPIYLPFISDKDAVMVDPEANTDVRNTTDPELQQAMVKVSSGTAQINQQDYTGVMSISQVPVDRTPRSLPSALNPSIIITMQPAGVDLAVPAAITLPNVDRHVPGAVLNLWSLDHETGEFFVAGIGQVSQDGEIVETIQGGVRGTSWHFFVVSVAGDGIRPHGLTQEEVNALTQIYVNMGLLVAGLVLPVTLPALVLAAAVGAASGLYFAGLNGTDTFSFNNINSNEMGGILIGMIPLPLAASALKIELEGFKSVLDLAGKRIQSQLSALEEGLASNPGLEATYQDVMSPLQNSADVLTAAVLRMQEDIDRAESVEETVGAMLDEIGPQLVEEAQQAAELSKTIEEFERFQESPTGDQLESFLEELEKTLQRIDEMPDNVGLSEAIQDLLSSPEKRRQLDERRLTLEEASTQST